MFNFLSGGRARTSNRIRAQRARNATKQHLRLESLENRQLLSLPSLPPGVTSPPSGNVTAVLAKNGEVYIKGDTNNNVIDIDVTTPSSTTAEVTITPVPGTTINGSTTPWNSGVGLNVSSIDLTFQNGNDTVYLHGTSSVPELQTVSLTFGDGADNIYIGETLSPFPVAGVKTPSVLVSDPFLANSVTVSATASSSPGGDAPKDVDHVYVENSTIATLSVTLGTAPGDSVWLEDNTNLGNVTVVEGSGQGDIIDVGGVSANAKLGEVSLTQNDGPGPKQNDVINVEDDVITKSLDITQGDGDKDNVYVNDISGLVTSTGAQYAKVVITQGGGQDDNVEVAYYDGTSAPSNVTVTASSVSVQSLTISQGFGNGDEVYVGTEGSYYVALYGPPVEVENFVGPGSTSTTTFSGGNLKITQGNGESDSVAVTFLYAKNATIIQGNGGYDTVDVEDTLLYGNLTINVGDGNNAEVAVGYSTPVLVNNETTIIIQGEENSLYLGGAGTAADLETNSLTVDIGLGGNGSNVVYADAVVVDNDDGTITAGGSDNTYVSSGGNSGFETYGFNG